MAFMLDTNVCIDLIRKHPDPILRHVRKHLHSGILISSITLSELEYGVARSARPDVNRLALVRFLLPFTSVAYDETAASAYGMIRSDLERRGMPIGPLDTLIAAHALALGATLVTSNVREFSHVAELKIENWAGTGV